MISTCYSRLSTFSPQAPVLEHLKRMIGKHPRLTLAGCGTLLIIGTPALFSNLFMLHQYSWINIPLQVQFAGVMIQIALIGIGMFLVSFAILLSIRRRFATDTFAQGLNDKATVLDHADCIQFSQGLTPMRSVARMRPWQLCPTHASARQRIIQMAEKGKGDKSRKEPQKKAVLSLKEKRKVKNDKKNSK